MAQRIRAWRRSALSLFLCTLALALWATPAAHAQDDDRSVTVLRRDGDITINTDGTVDVVETWETRFDGGPFRFAFRSIPLNRVNDITDWSVSEGGTAYQQGNSEQPGTFTLERDGGERKITWYFPPTTDATRVFTLRYTLDGALRIYPDGDQFFWKFIESDRGYPILASRVIVRLPAEFDPGQLLAATYLNGDENSEGGRIVDGSAIEFTGRDFGSGDEWEIRAQWPHGVVQAEPAAWQIEEDAITARQPFYNLVALGSSLLVLIGGGLGLVLLWYSRGRDKPSEAVAPYYSAPPEDVPPGMVGTLLDERADMKDILATLIDLARRGYLVIEESKGRSWFSDTPNDFIFVRGQADSGALQPFERRLYDKLFGMTINERRLSSLKNQFYSEIGALQSDLYEATVSAGYFDRNPNTTRNLYTVLGSVMLVLSVGGCFLGSVLSRYSPLIFLVPIAFGIVSLAMLVLSRFMSRKTTRGSTSAAKWRAFKRYLENIDRYTEVAAAKDQFERYLPYAIAFGLEREWVRQFERVQTPAPIWYHPYGYPHVGYGSYGGGDSRSAHSGGSGGGSFGGGGAPSLDQTAGRAFGGLNAMSAGLFGMLNAASTTFTSQPQPSGGGSGGFSGGGGGGGGGSSGFG